MLLLQRLFDHVFHLCCVFLHLLLFCAAYGLFQKIKFVLLLLVTEQPLCMQFFKRFLVNVNNAFGANHRRQ